MGRRVDAELLVGASDIKERLGFLRVQDVHSRRRKDPTFPEPVAIVGGGGHHGMLVWYMPDIERWARQKGLAVKPAGGGAKPVSKSARQRESELVELRRELAELAGLRERLGDLAQLRERLEALEAEASDDEASR